VGCCSDFARAIDQRVWHVWCRGGPAQYHHGSGTDVQLQASRETSRYKGQPWCAMRQRILLLVSDIEGGIGGDGHMQMEEVWV
jgi:hypothetical protein